MFNHSYLFALAIPLEYECWSDCQGPEWAVLQLFEQLNSRYWFNWWVSIREIVQLEMYRTCRHWWSLDVSTFTVLGQQFWHDGHGRLRCSWLEQAVWCPGQVSVHTLNGWFNWSPAAINAVDWPWKWGSYQGLSGGVRGDISLRRKISTDFVMTSLYTNCDVAFWPARRLHTMLYRW